MNFIEAIEIAKHKSTLIGSNIGGHILDDILVVPTNPSELKQFQQLFLETLDPYKSIAPFMNTDVKVIGIFNKQLIREQNIFCYMNI